MNIQFTSEPLHEVQHRVLVVLADAEGKTLNGGEQTAALLEPFIASEEFGKGFGGTVYLPNPTGTAVQRLLFFNMGKKLEKPEEIRRATARCWKGLRAKGFKSLLFSLDGIGDDTFKRAAVEGFLFGDYQYNAMKTETDKLPNKLEDLLLHCSEDVASKVQTWNHITQGSLRARDLCQMPANILTPAHLADLTVQWGREDGLEVTILDQAQLEEEKMGAMLGVAQGSDNVPKLIIMDYKPANPSGKTVALVGKAVTFDAGGLNLKLSKMEEMKGDMGGGATVVGIMSVLKNINCPHRVVGLVPAVENMPSAKAMRPSDVLTSKAGITVEVYNTDAEGRLILIDALTYASRFEPDYVIDLATLTGACLVALGPKIFGVMGNHQPLIDAIVKSGWALGEPFWQLPLFDDYKDMLKSQTADISNCPSSRWGGAITAGLFLERFARDYKWAHCDIAASIFEKSDELNPVGGIGAGVRTLVDVFDNLEALG